ncbi:MAG: hypothetical protein H7311_09770 [Ramlibacter sp.]|nr:hypothetical protein [Cryobacterium sp.]
MAGSRGGAGARSFTGRSSTMTVWVLAALALVVGGAGFATANHIDDVTGAVFATELSELHGDLGRSAAVAAELSARTDAVSSAMAAYVRAAEDHMAVRNELVEGFNRGIDEYNDSGAVDIVRTELPSMIERYRAAVADLAERQAELAAAVDKVDGSAP